jgi:biopolymer transport protein ExbB
MKLTLPRFLTLLALAMAALLFVAAPAFAQEAAEGTAEAATSAPEGETLIDVIVHGGPGVILVWLVLVGTSMVMVTLVIQNLIMLRVPKLAPPTMVESLRQTLAAGNYQEAWEICNANSNYVANVLKAGLERIGRGKEATEDALAEHALREAQLIRTRNSYLSVIGVVSPMIGLLGTVIGMIGAFAVLGQSGISDPRALSAKIGEVLYATASGLFIAIPAFIFYYIFRNRSQAVIVYADDVINTLVSDLPYEELQGVKIGENFSAGVAPVAAPVGGAPAGPGARTVSAVLTTNCPVCNGAVAPGQNPCPHCGATLNWAG